MRLTRVLFLATIFSVTFEKVHWDVAGQVSLADLLAIGFIASFAADRIARGDLRLPRTSIVGFGFLIAFLLVYLVGYYNLDTAVAAAQYGKGMTKFVIHFLFLITGVAYLARAARTYYWQALGFFTAGMVCNAIVRHRAAALRARRRQPRQDGAVADHGRRELDQHLRRDRGRGHLPPERAHR